MLLADNKNEEGPTDPFKTVHFPLPIHNNVAENVNKITYECPTEDIYSDGPGMK
jgi:hypothetical protein